jgi:hypothetical protein
MPGGQGDQVFGTAKRMLLKKAILPTTRCGRAPHFPRRRTGKFRRVSVSWLTLFAARTGFMAATGGVASIFSGWHTTVLGRKS